MTSNPLLDSIPTQLNEEATHFLLNYGRRLEYRSGQAVVREGESSDNVYIILKGEANITKNDDAGHNTLIATAGKGSIIGEMGVFLDLKRSATITAKDALTVIQLSNEDFIKALQSFPTVSMRLLRSFSHKLHDVNQKLVTTRHAYHMLYLGMRLLNSGSAGDGAAQTRNLNLDAIAEHAGLLPLDLTNALLDYQRLGIIRDLKIEHGRTASFVLREDALREFIDRAAQ